MDVVFLGMLAGLVIGSGLLIAGCSQLEGK